MEQESPEVPYSLFDRVIGRQRPAWATAAAIGLLLFVPVAAAAADGILANAWEQGFWRYLMLPSVIVSYIVFLAPAMSAVAAATWRSLRRVVLLDDATFSALVGATGGIPARGEVAAASLGALVGLLISVREISAALAATFVVWLILSACMYGLLAWVVARSVEGSRLMLRLMRQPMRVDPLDVTPFEPLARQSLLLSLIFVGGITLSLALTDLSAQLLTKPAFWLVYLPLAAVPVLIFFLNLYPTHRVLAAARDRELAAVERGLHEACRRLMRLKEEGSDLGAIPAEIAAWAAYRNELLGARTWPYNTGLLRTLFFSVLVPGGTLLGRVAAEIIRQ